MAARPLLLAAFAVAAASSGAALAQTGVAPPRVGPLHVTLGDSAFTAPGPGGDPVEILVTAHNAGADTLLFVGAGVPVEVSLQRWGGAGWEDGYVRFPEGGRAVRDTLPWAADELWGYREMTPYVLHGRSTFCCVSTRALAPGESYPARVWAREPGVYRAVVRFYPVGSYRALEVAERAREWAVEPEEAYSPPFTVADGAP